MRRARSPRRRFIVGLFVPWLVGFAAGCRSFHPPPAPPPRRAANGETVLNLGYLKKKQTLEIEGSFDEGRFTATRIEVEEPDKEVEIKGVFEGADDGGRSATVSGVSVSVTPKSNIKDKTGSAIDIRDVPPGAWVKVECHDVDDELRVRKLTVRDRKPDESEELQGRVQSLDTSRGHLVIGGIPVGFPPDILIVWDVEGSPPPSPQERGDPVTTRTATGHRRVRRFDDDDWRPDTQLVIDDTFVIGGEIRYALQLRQNHNLRRGRRRDRLLHDVSTKIEIAADLSPNVFAFAQFRAKQEWVIFDEDKNFDLGASVTLGETYLLLDDIPVDGVALQIGRQDFDHGREWVMDENLDAVRLYLNTDFALFEVSASTTIFGAPFEKKNIDNFLLAAHAEPLEDQKLFAYALHRSGGRTALSRTHVGFTLEGELRDFEYWLDAAYVFGRESGHSVSAYGVDAAAMYVLEGMPAEPSLFLGFAYGSGDSSPGKNGDHNFRQTGLQDNNDKFNGVTSFRYLGELVRPELSNLMVFTAGFGIKPTKHTSIDFVYHHYRQVEAAPFIRRSRIRLDPTGRSKSLGNAYEVIIGFEDLRPAEFEFVLSYFNPGAAFGITPDDAWFVTFQAKYNF